MKTSSARALSITLLSLATLGFASPTYAYLDPGTGSMILQGIIAGLAVASLTIKTYWYRFKSLFSGKSDDKEQSETKSSPKSN